MRTVVDTSSLVAMARYYRPFDTADNLDTYLRSEIKNGSLIVLDKVLAESRYVSQGLAYLSFSCLHGSKVAMLTVGLQPSRKFYNMLDNNFIDKTMKRMKFADDEVGYQNVRETFLNSADCALIVYSMTNNTAIDPIRILTEENPNQNDGKLFKKIPSICEQLEISTINAVDYLKQIDSLNVEIKAISKTVTILQ